jgi:hypothetical protein
MAKDDILGMYNELMNEINNSNMMNFNSNKKQYNNNKKFNDNDEDTEVFMTSEEKVKEEQKADEILADKRGYVPGEIEESAVFKRYTQKRQHKYTAQEMELIEDSCRRVIVHDYAENDFYHISDEERSKHDQLAEVAIKLGSVKRIYRRIDQYIEAMRIVYKAWDILATSNYLHTREEFFGSVASGNIVSNRIIQPKMKRIDDYNKDKIIQYISDETLDPKDLLPNEVDPYDQFYTDEEYEEEQARLLSSDEIEYMINYDENHADGMSIKDIDWKYIKQNESSSFNIKKKKKKSKKKIKKSEKKLRESVSALVSKISNGNHYKTYGHSFGLTEDIFKEIKEKSIYDAVKFNGSWQDKDAVKIYDLVLTEAMLSDHPDNERHMTYGDKELQTFYNTMERHGMNTVELRRRISGEAHTYDVAKQKANRKENKRIESALINRINGLSKDPKFKKLVTKAEKKLDEYRKNEND